MQHLGCEAPCTETLDHSWGKRRCQLDKAKISWKNGASTDSWKMDRGQNSRGWWWETFVERWAHQRRDLLSCLPLILWLFRIMVVWSCWFFRTFVVLDVISALQSRGWNVHLLYSMYSRMIYDDTFRSMVEATEKWFWPGSECDRDQSQCKYNIVLLSSLFNFLITIDEILIPQICCIFVCIQYMYLCFTHKKNKSFHHEPVFFPLDCVQPQWQWRAYVMPHSLFFSVVKGKWVTVETDTLEPNWLLRWVT